MQYDVNNGLLQVVIEGEEINVVVGEAAQINVGEAINYIQTGTAEIGQAVQEGISDFNDNATSKTNDFNDNASNKTTDFNTNASNKTSSFNENYTEKLNDFNSNAQDKTGDFNDNATDKTNDFNSNATDKTTDFNDNYIAKKEIIDEKAEEASGYADTAKQYAIGEPTEPTGNSAKYWANQAASTLSGLSSRVSDIEDLIPNTASSSNQLTDENFVNSSIATNTANFIGTFANVTALNAYSGTVTNNDYAFVTNSVVTDNGNDWATFNDLNAYDKSLLTDFDYAWVINGANFDLYRFDIVNQVWVQRATNIQKSSVTLNSAFNRYKATVNGGTTWNYEYTLNNSSFTAAQWAAINSSITSEKVALITPFIGADGTNAGTTGLVTAPSATDNAKFLKGDGTWDFPTAQTAFANITGQPSDNTNLATALNAKAGLADNNTFSGTNTFSEVDVFNSKSILMKIKNTVIDKSNPPSSNLHCYTDYIDKNGSRLGVIGGRLMPNGNFGVYMQAGNEGGLAIYSDGTTAYTQAPTPATSDNSTKIATTAFVRNVLETIYPIGSIYIGIQAACPLSSLFGTWVLVSSGRVLQGADSGHSAGTTIEAGLPNIEGTSSVNALNTNTTGAFYTDNKQIAVYGSLVQGIALSFDASRYNSIYGNSTTVQPPAYVVNIWQRTA